MPTLNDLYNLTTSSDPMSYLGNMIGNVQVGGGTTNAPSITPQQNAYQFQPGAQLSAPTTPVSPSMTNQPGMGNAIGTGLTMPMATQTPTAAPQVPTIPNVGMAQQQNAGMAMSSGQPMMQAQNAPLAPTAPIQSNLPMTQQLPSLQQPMQAQNYGGGAPINPNAQPIAALPPSQSNALTSPVVQPTNATAQPVAAPPEPVKKPEEVQHERLQDIHNEPDFNKKQQQYIDFFKGEASPENKALAMKLLNEDYKRYQDQREGQKQLESMTPNDLARAMRKETDEGSVLKYYIASRLGLTDMAKNEANKLGYNNMMTTAFDPETGERYSAVMDGNGQIRNAYNFRGEEQGQDTVAKLSAMSMGMKGAQTGQALHQFTAPDGTKHIVSQTIMPNGQGVRFYDETDKKFLANAPAGMEPMGRVDPKERAITVGRQQIITKMQKDNASAIATTGKPLFTDSQIQDQANRYEMRMRGTSPEEVNMQGEASAGVQPPLPAASTAQQTGQMTTQSGATLTAQQDALQKRLSAPIISGVRSAQEQESLKDHQINGKWFTKEGNPVADNSLHLSGNALDIQADKLTNNDRKILASEGWYQPIPKQDPNHWEKLNPATTGAPQTAATTGAKSQAQKIADYEMPAPPPGNRDAGSVALRNEVLRLNPDYDPSKYAVAAKTRQAFTTGTEGKTIRSANVFIDHAATLKQAIDALNNVDTRLFNKYANQYQKNTGQPAPTDFEATKRIVGDELVKAITGSSGALADREEASHSLSAANSPAQLRSVVDQYTELMAAQVKGLKKEYEEVGLKDFDKKLLPSTMKALQNAEIRKTQNRSSW